LFDYKSIPDYHKDLLANATSVENAVAFYLDRIAAHQHLNAFVEVFEEEARARAKALDEARAGGKVPGKMHGVVVAIKDVLCYAGHRVTAASKILDGFVSPYSATAVQKLIDEEAIIIGTANCDEFAMGSSNEHSVYGRTLNGLDETRVPGGSSGGSAVAVQMNLCMVSLGSDTGGSVRQPADFCGIYGLKPTYGRVSRYGLIAYASSFDQVGIFGNNLADVSRVLEVISGGDNYDSTVAPLPAIKSDQQTPGSKPLKVAYFKDALDHPGLDPEMRETINQFFAHLPADEFELEPVSVDFLDYIVPTYYVLTTAEASSNLSRFDGVRYGHRERAKDLNFTDFYKANRSTGFGKEVQRRIMLGSFVLSSGYYDAYFTKAQRVRQKLLAQTKELFNKFDAIFLPTVPAPAFRFGENSEDPVSMYLADIYTVYANLTGIPAISLPLFRHSGGLPFGLQVMTDGFLELSLLDISARLMAHARPAPQSHPK
jgi:aspartyl-tRNA(Asn)/glutamyl-tRNA(Gln) amidotransferase subunit A